MHYASKLENTDEWIIRKDKSDNSKDKKDNKNKGEWINRNYGISCSKESNGIIIPMGRYTFLLFPKLYLLNI